MNTKGLFFRFFFIVSSSFTKNLFLLILGFPIRFLYKLIIQWILGIDIPDTTIIGENLKIYHGQGLVVNSNVIIGNNVVLRQNTTIGPLRDGAGAPIIGNNVEVGANCIILGNIVIGNNSIIGAGAIVVKSVPDNSKVLSNYSKVISK